MFYVGNDAGSTVLGEFCGSFDFWKHRAGLKIAVFFESVSFGYGDFAELFLSGKTIINIYIRNGSDGNEDIGFDEFSELFGSIIFVNNGINAFEASQDFSASDWDAAATCSNDNDVIFEKIGNGLFFDNIDGFRRRYNSTPTTPGVFFDCPVVFDGKRFGFFFGIELTDWLGGIIKGWIFTVYDDLRDDSSDFFALIPFSKSVMNGLSKPITDLTLAHSYGGFEWHGWSFF